MPWHTVRVFISSTFRDMHAERDHLVKVVFPELRERMAQRQLHLVDLDLRWGVTEAEAEQGKVLDIVLDEINRSRPFFIGILGERYGTVPDELPEDVRLAHPWLAEYSGHSLTALEIVHGVLRNPELARRCLFYFRDPQFIADVPEGKRADFLAESAEAARKVAALKAAIRASGRPVMEDYPWRWDDPEGRVAGLEEFGQRVLEDLWAAIGAEYPEEAPEADPLDIERGLHEAFVEERSRFHIGRDDQAARLTEYVRGADRRPAVITGESGCGKSAFLASWYLRYAAAHPDDFVLAYFVGASPDSTNHWRLLRTMCQELKRQFGLDEELPEDDKKLSETLATLLAAASQVRQRIVVVVDALDQLSPLEGAHGLGWLLDYLPERTRLVVSSLEGDCLDVLRRHQAEEFALPPLTPAEQRQIIQALLDEWRRKLDERQMTALLAHPGVGNPLYLRVALEELRLFGVFERLTARIRALAEDVPGLFGQVLARLEADHGRELVAEAFALLACSRYGLSEAELLDLLRRPDEEQLPRSLWARLARDAGAYLVQRGELIGFFHRQLGAAVAARYPSRDARHEKLAAYFERAAPERKLDEYPYQLQHAQQWPALAAALSDLDFFVYAWEHGREYEWMGYWRALEGRYEPGQCYQAVIEARERTQSESLVIAKLLDYVGSFLSDMALYSSALPLLRRALAIWMHVPGANHLAAADSLVRLGGVYCNQGLYTEAMPIYQNVVAILERVLDPDDSAIATPLVNLALVYMEHGRYVEASSILQRALAINERAHGSNHLLVAHNLAALARLYRIQANYAEALPLAQRALAIMERAVGPEHPEATTGLKELGWLYFLQGNHVQALALLQQALAIDARVFGPNHPDVADTLEALSRVRYMQDQYSDALRLALRARRIELWESGQFTSFSERAWHWLSWGGFALMLVIHATCGMTRYVLRRIALVSSRLKTPASATAGIVRIERLIGEMETALLTLGSRRGVVALEMQAYVAGLGFGYVCNGIIRVVTSASEPVEWMMGGIALAIGVISLLNRRRSMFILLGVPLFLSGIMNVFGGETMWGISQLLIGYVIVSMFMKYASVG